MGMVAELRESAKQQQIGGDRDERAADLIERLVASLKEMCAEFRGHDLPYGSKAYLNATTLLNEIKDK